MTKRILVYDDEREIADRIKEILLREGYDVVTALDGRHAVELLKEGSVDFVLTDANIPDLGGLGLVTLISGRNPFDRKKHIERYFAGKDLDYDDFLLYHLSTPVLLMSVDPDNHGPIARQFGAVGCFVKSRDTRKPFDEAALIRALKHYIPK